MLIDGKWRFGAKEYDVIDPYRKEVVGRAPISSAEDLDDALVSAVAAKAKAAAVPGYKRAELLHKVVALLDQRAEEIARIITRETGKALKDTRLEVLRARDTLVLSAEEAVRIEGEHVPLDASEMGAGKIAMLLRFPVGVIAGITPFNAPFNLAAHKIGPAVASGNVIVLKAPPQSPLCVFKLVELFHDAGAPPGLVSVLYGNDVGPQLVRDKRVDFITFTGSTKVGAEIKAASGLKRVALELGGTGQTIIHSDGDIEKAAPLCARNSMRLAGQSCISVQNIYAHTSVYDRFVTRLLEEVRKLKTGDPLDPETDVGTLIDEGAATRVQTWVDEAIAGGARALHGGTREGAQITPTLLVDVEPDMKVVCNEVFGPAVSVQRYSDLDTIIELISENEFGLQCGIFTGSVTTAIDAAKRLRTGGVIINGTSTWRVDQLPYGGVKSSGIGREGPRYAIRDMTDERFIVFNM
jgi:acyl-CoA reductase-like NAD-dependent aldehyde dehydrogenase